MHGNLVKLTGRPLAPRPERSSSAARTNLCTTRTRPRRDLSVTWPSQGTFPRSHRSARGPALPARCPVGGTFRPTSSAPRLGEPVELPLRPPGLNCDVPALHVAQLAQALPEGVEEVWQWRAERDHPSIPSRAGEGAVGPLQHAPSGDGRRARDHDGRAGAGGKSPHARVRRVDQPATVEGRTWGATS